MMISIHYHDDEVKHCSLVQGRRCIVIQSVQVGGGAKHYMSVYYEVTGDFILGNL